jgi:hypothetical protein
VTGAVERIHAGPPELRAYLFKHFNDGQKLVLHFFGQLVIFWNEIIMQFNVPCHSLGV